MTTTYTQDHRLKLEEYLAAHELPSGLGSWESACTLAAINLALSGKLTDDIPDCMSKVLGKATIRLQDDMPDEMRNGARYKALIPNMPGTGQEHESERLVVLMDWMWAVVLPQVQPIADEKGFGSEWRTMCETKTADAAAAAVIAARAYAARAAAYAADAARAAAYDTARAAAVVRAASAAAAAVIAARAAAYDTARAARAAAYAVGGNFWTAVDPIGVLERMTYLGEKE